MNDSIDKWLTDWLSRNNPLISASIDPATEYYKSGLVDSFGIIELIVDIENKFMIKFDDSDFRKDKFRTIKGLGELIREKLN
jgi:acyl carrier protein